MKRYNYLQTIYLSFFSRDLYRDVAKNWGGGVVLYLFILLLICWAVMIVRYQPVINHSFQHIANELAPQIPEIHIKKGEVSTPENRPYLIKDKESGETIIIIDTSGKYPDLNETPSSTKVLITHDKVYYVDDSNSERIQKIPAKITVEIKPDQVKQSLIKIADWLWVIFLPILLILSFAYRLVQALIYAVIGKIFSALSNASLSYAELLKLSMVAVTPVIVISTILDWFSVAFPFQWLLYFIITMAYLIFAIGANKTN